eukprot:TRINITY_DN4720_c0_g1_i1.p1 TRINITY_DN4720_c0_g1~~TRINITY_DN4720_c0_g1_i1.p1  ORF type:complete len:448 (+),score=109.18 TRINITY_DN4720_c0_g1_i1:138-1346(+)
MLCHGEEQMQLRLLTEFPNAVCLDGTPAGYYFRPGSGEDKANWQIFLQGGGWCYGLADCWERSRTATGSSRLWMRSIRSPGGPMSTNCTENPVFCNYNMVYVHYCDGGGYAGNRNEPVEYAGEKIYFRGRSIVEAVMRDIYRIPGVAPFAEAQSVLLGGCSAGGLAAFMYADEVAQVLPPSVTKYAVLPVSGFFLDHNNTDGRPVFSDQIKSTLRLANSTMPAPCLAAMHPDDRWKCHFARYVYPHVRSRVFALNSMHDSWQISCILTAEYVSPNSTNNGACAASPRWHSCLKRFVCDDAEMNELREFGASVVKQLAGSATADRPGNGGFIDACPRHCEAMSGWNSIVVNGVTPQEAVAKWWLGSPIAPAAANWHVDPPYNEEPPYQPNPTCTSSRTMPQRT